MRADRSSSGARRIDEGCTVAITGGSPAIVSSTRPRSRITLKLGPSSDCAATAPIRTSRRGATISIGPQPGLTGDHVGTQRPLVEPPLAALLPAEVLDGVRDVGAIAVDPRALEGVVEHAPSRPHERVPLDVLPITRLLAHEDDHGVGRALPEDGLGAAAPEVAAPALRRCRAHHGEITRVRDVALGAGLRGHERLAPLVAGRAARSREERSTRAIDHSFPAGRAANPRRRTRRRVIRGVAQPVTVNVWVRAAAELSPA